MASDANGTITFTEVDEVNNPTATYIYSGVVDQSMHLPQHDKNNSTGRLDVIVCFYILSRISISCPGITCMVETREPQIHWKSIPLSHEYSRQNQY